jgi:predicted dehydrogenase
MKIRFAFAGFRHGHIFDLLTGVLANPELSVVAACEEDAETRNALKSRNDLTITHDNFEKMLCDVECDVIAIGDYYTRRGRLAIRTLETGRHIISDKPLCTTLEEYQTINDLARSRGRVVGCQFDLRSSGIMNTARRLIQAGELGPIHTVAFSGQHPLLLGSRPAWYFQPGCHGGTINDIAIHAMDTIPWLTGRKIVAVTAARAWNAKTPSHPHFQDSAQLMLQLDNQGGVLGDVSYLAPDGCGYAVPQYWRFTIHGSNGVLEMAHGSKTVLIATHPDKEPRCVEAEPNLTRVYLADFLAQVKGEKQNVSLTTDAVLAATRLALLTQRAADNNQTNLSCD